MLDELNHTISSIRAPGSQSDMPAIEKYWSIYLPCHPPDSLTVLPPICRLATLSCGSPPSSPKPAISPIGTCLAQSTTTLASIARLPSTTYPFSKNCANSNNTASQKKKKRIADRFWSCSRIWLMTVRSSCLR